MVPSTFSIVAYDPAGQAWGVAVASKFLAVGAVVPWARAGVGAVATQSHARMSFGPDGLALMAQDKSAPETLQALLATDPEHEQRQVGIVDARGGSAAHTGSACHSWAGHKTGEGFACQGNILVGARVIESMADAFRGSSGDLPQRLLASLRAGDDAGGDRRGKQSAALLVVRPEGGYGGDNDRYLDLRVDDHPDPVLELGRLVGLHHLFFQRARPQDLVPVTEVLAREIQAWLQSRGYLQHAVSGVWDDASKQAFWDLVSVENLEERWNLDGNTDAVDRVALEYLRERFR